MLNIKVKSTHGVLKDGVFFGEFKGKVANGTLIGVMKGELTGNKITA